MRVSIHAPAWGATLVEKCSLSQPAVSIHAPAWGATSLPRTGRQPRNCFNPRARVGRDMLLKTLERKGFTFQSTRPRGARRNTNTFLRPRASFNPRARVGRDLKVIS